MKHTWILSLLYHAKFENSKRRNEFVDATFLPPENDKKRDALIICEECDRFNDAINKIIDEYLKEMMRDH